MTLQDIERAVGELSFADLVTHKARVEELVAQRREERRVKVEQEAAELGFKLLDLNGGKPRRRRKHHDAA
jgi:uncharacterized protein (DUF58 family)